MLFFIVNITCQNTLLIYSVSKLKITTIFKQYLKIAQFYMEYRGNDFNFGNGLENRLVDNV